MWKSHPYEISYFKKVSKIFWHSVKMVERWIGLRTGWSGLERFPVCSWPDRNPVNLNRTETLKWSKALHLISSIGELSYLRKYHPKLDSKMYILPTLKWGTNLRYPRFWFTFSHVLKFSWSWEGSSPRFKKMRVQAQVYFGCESNSNKNVRVHRVRVCISANT